MQTALANQDIDEGINSPLTRERLHALQGGVTDLDLEVLRHREMLERRRGVVEASNFIAKRLFQEHGPLDEAFKEGDDSEGALIRARKETVTKLTNIVGSIAAENQASVHALQAKIEGIAFSSSVLAKRFNSEVEKYERHIEESTLDVDGVDELGRTPEDRENLAKSHLDPRDNQKGIDPKTLAEKKAAKARDDKTEKASRAAQRKADKAAKVEKKRTRSKK